MDLITMTFLPDKRVAQLIDANLDRAREGLRVVEDWCRFGIKNQDFVIKLKDWRQKLGSFHHQKYKQARASSQDECNGLSHPEQIKRSTPEQIVSANCARVQEACRAIEEFSRDIHPELAKAAAIIRYEIYDLEVSIIQSTNSQKRRKKLDRCFLYLVTTDKENLYHIVSSAIQSGVTMVQYRSKSKTDLIMLQEAHELCLLCKKNHVLFIVNDRIDIAMAVDADGVHLGQDDLPTKIVKIFS